MTSHTPHRIGVFEGNKIIEIKSIDINKGRTAAKWISKKKWDFMIAIGDDLTDEDLFNETPPFCYSLKVGNAPSQAKFYTESPRSIKSLLQELA
jgi:trehalose 6-phosphate synthase/phosphatase